MKGRKKEETGRGVWGGGKYDENCLKLYSHKDISPPKSVPFFIQLNDHHEQQEKGGRTSGKHETSVHLIAHSFVYTFRAKFSRPIEKAH